MGILIAVPTGFEDAIIYKETERCVAKVIETDESSIIRSGMIQSGEQRCKILILNGLYKAEIVEGVNLLSGSLETDKIYKIGDKAHVVISHKDNHILSTMMTDHYRIGKEVIVALIFITLLILFAGINGLYAVFSFVITILMIWKILIPFYLKGFNPVLIGLVVILSLTICIIFMVYGMDKRFLAAFAGSTLGIMTTCILGLLFTNAFQIHGAVMAYSESLLYAGYQHLNLTQIFIAAIFIGASGAMMDLAVDITSAVYEVIEKKPSITWKEAAKSGMNVGRAAMGTMTTTLLLAYLGGYVALLMVFMAQGTPIDHIINYKYVAAEILDTLIGSIGLVTVAPFTALMSGIMLVKKEQKLG